MKTQNTIKTETSATYLVNALDLDNENQVIAKAMAILESRIKTHGIAFTSPEVTQDYLRLNFAGAEREHFNVLFLDNQHRLIENNRMFSGTIDSASVYPREVVKRALEVNAAAVIFAHNHPSGICNPSQADKAITSKLKECLKLFEVRVLDHFIIGDGKPYSFAEHGLI